MKRSRVDSYGVHCTIVGSDDPPSGRYTSAESEMPSRIGTRWSCRSRTSSSGTLRALERLRDQRAGEVARGEMAVALPLERRLDLGADRLRERATRPEAAAARRGHRARHVARQHAPLALSAHDKAQDS